MGDRPGPRRGGHDGALDHAIPRRGRPASRPDSRHRPRQGYRRGHPKRAQGLGRIGHPARTAARPRRSARGRTGTLAGTRRARAPRVRPCGALGEGLRSRTRRARSRGIVPIRRRTHRLLTGAAEPRRSIPGSDGPPGRERQRGGCRMTTTSAQPVREETLRSALSSRARPPRPNALSASLTFGWRALLKIKHVPEQLFDVTAFPIMFTLMFTYLFGGALAGSTGEYLQFLLPGILVQTVVFITMYTGMGLNTDITRGVFDRFRSLPVWRPAALVGALLGDAARYAMASAMVIVLGLILGFRPDGGVAGVLLSVALLLVFSFSLSWIWTALGLILRTPNSVMMASFLILFPLTFASNIFVDPETMPAWLQAIVGANPITHLVTAVRGLMHGTVTAGAIGWVLLTSGALVAAFAPLTMYLYRNKK